MKIIRLRPGLLIHLSGGKFLYGLRGRASGGIYMGFATVARYIYIITVLYLYYILYILQIEKY